MDNQQTNPYLELGWMAGIIDGEGWLILNEQKLPSQNMRYVPVVGVNCTSQLMIDEMQRICKIWQVGTWIGRRNFQNDKWKDQFVINIRGFERVDKFLEIVSPHLVLKHKQAEVLREYIKHRRSLPMQSPTGKTEQAFRQQLQDLNQKGKSQRLNS